MVTARLATALRQHAEEVRCCPPHAATRDEATALRARLLDEAEALDVDRPKAVAA